MRATLTWVLMLLGVYAAVVYLFSRSRTWAMLALASERISYGARNAYNALKLREQEERAAAWERLARQQPRRFPGIGPAPDRKPVQADDATDAVIFAIDWLRRNRRR